MKVKELLEFLESLMAKPCIQGWEEEKKDGLMIGDLEDEVKKIAVAWKPTKDVLEKAAEIGANVLIFHEDLFYEYKPYLVKGRPFSAIEANRDRLKITLKSNLNLIRFHTMWDDAPDGNNDTLAKLFNLENVERYPCIRVGYLKEPMTAKQLATYTKRVLNTPYVILAGNENKIIRKVIIIAGAGAKHIAFLDFTKKIGADAIISGDSNADTISYAYESGIVLIDPGHQYLEQIGMKSLAEKLKKELKIPVEFIENAQMYKVL